MNAGSITAGMADSKRLQRLFIPLGAGFAVVALWLITAVADPFPWAETDPEIGSAGERNRGRLSRWFAVAR